MTEKQRFQEVLEEIRSDILFLQVDLFDKLVENLKAKNNRIDLEVKTGYLTYS